jgi:single-strand DNA-binding protein
MSVNKVILVGNVGQDPEVRYIESNTPVCNIRLATSEVYKNKNGERVTSTEWHTVVLWRGLAEVAEKYVKKGSQLYVEGKIRTRSWDDKDGNKRYATEIVADVLQLLGRREDSGSAAPAPHTSEPKEAPSQNAAPEALPEADDLPF